MSTILTLCHGQCAVGTRDMLRLAGMLPPPAYLFFTDRKEQHAPNL